jgi:hypothetical protein
MVSMWIRRLGFLGIALALVASFSRPAEASGEGLLPFALALPLLPSEGGVTMTTGTSPPRGVIGWSWQLALGDDLLDAARRHHIVGPSGKSWSARLGYRYSLGDVFVCAGPAFDPRGVSVSPELGFKLAHAEKDHDEIDPSLHVSVRGQVAADGFRGATLLLGWSVF